MSEVDVWSTFVLPFFIGFTVTILVILLASGR